MGYMRAHAIIVTGWADDQVEQAHAEAKRIFAKSADSAMEPNMGRLVSDIVRGVVNSVSSFFVAPDGSKEGWSTSDIGNDLRDEFVAWLRAAGLYLDWCEVIVGSDDHEYRIVRSEDDDPSDNGGTAP